MDILRVVLLDEKHDRSTASSSSSNNANEKKNAFQEFSSHPLPTHFFFFLSLKDKNYILINYKGNLKQL